GFHLSHHLPAPRSQSRGHPRAGGPRRRHVFCPALAPGLVWEGPLLWGWGVGNERPTNTVRVSSFLNALVAGVSGRGHGGVAAETSGAGAGDPGSVAVGAGRTGTGLGAGGGEGRRRLDQADRRSGGTVIIAGPPAPHRCRPRRPRCRAGCLVFGGLA